jgi:hypothetical protein
MSKLDVVTSSYVLNTAVLLVVFNRLDTTKHVLQSIRCAAPSRLYIASDGARANKKGEVSDVNGVREYILNNIDWKCDVKTYFSEDNAGCKNGVSNAINWFFEHEEEGIILEDDCVAHPSFFRFCQELLEKYKNDQRIGMISGDNFQFGHKLNDDSYYFSNHTHIWGWASWRNRWVNDYDVFMTQWPKIRDEKRMLDWFGSSAEQIFFADLFEKVHQNKIDTWDYQWNFANRINGRVTVIPNVNLISNIGFGEGATHTAEVSVLADMETEEMVFPLSHPKGIFASLVLDSRYFNKFIAHSFLGKIKMRLAALLKA